MRIKGRVIRGQGIGKILGFSTANLDCEVPKDINGVFACHVFFNGEAYNGVAIFQDNKNPEIHILNWNQDIIGVMLEVEILKKISEIKSCASHKALIEKIKNDVKKVREYFSH